MHDALKQQHNIQIPMPESAGPFDLRPGTGSAASPHGPHSIPSQQAQQQQQVIVQQQLLPAPQLAAPVTHLRSGPPIDLADIETSDPLCHGDMSDTQHAREQQQHPIGPVVQTTYAPTQPPLSPHGHSRGHAHQPLPLPDQHGSFGILTPGPAVPNAAAVRLGESLVGPSGYIPIDGTTAPGWRPHGSLLSSKWVIDPPNLDEWRQKLFDADGLIILSNDQQVSPPA